MNRFLTTSVLVGLALVSLMLSSCTQRKESSEPSWSDARRARTEATRRQRRIIFNDDGGDLFDPESNTPEGFLGVRLKRLVGTHVDTISWSVTKGDAPNYDSKIQPIFWDAHAEPSRVIMDALASNLKALIAAGNCPLKIVTDFAHTNGMEAFASLRMNDVHDSLWPGWVTKWKKENPQFLVDKTGMLEERKLYVTAQDFSHEEVRRRKFEIIEEVCDRYDIDGVELDYIRQPVLFSRSMRGLEVNEQEVAIMTRFMRRIRKRMDEIAARRGRPLLLAARVPDTFDLAMKVGLDLDRWGQEGLVDILIPGGGYAPHSLEVAGFTQAAHEHDLLVYPCCNVGVGLGHDNHGIVEDMRGLAARWHRAGADGIYLWNMFGPREVDDDRHTALSELGEPGVLAGKDKLYGLDGPVLEHYAFISSPTPLPLLLKEGTPQRLSLAIGDDLQAVARAGSPTELSLQLQGPVGKDQLRLRLNGKLLTGGVLEGPQAGDSKYVVSYSLSGPPLKMGENTFQVSLTGGGGSTVEPVKLSSLHLWVKYTQ